MAEFIFIPQLDSTEVSQVLREHRFRLPENVRSEEVRRWHRGYYYGYGRSDMWIPLTSLGGMATRAFHDHGVKFPARIDKALRMLLIGKRIKERAKFKVE